MPAERENESSIEANVNDSIHDDANISSSTDEIVVDEDLDDFIKTIMSLMDVAEDDFDGGMYRVLDDLFSGDFTKYKTWPRS